MGAESEDLNFYGNDPGAVKFGNFINYYSFHDVSERIGNLHPKMLPDLPETPLVCLDVGCNTGELTQELYTYLKSLYPLQSIQILAVDIDPTLIERAKQNNKNPDITFVTCNIMDEDNQLVINSYLNNLDITCFGITFCFSVTMWIHLNNGDDGLLRFLNLIKNISKTIIIEPQPWKCYRNAQRRIKKSGKSFENYTNLNIKSDVDLVIEKILTEDSHFKVYESKNSSWNRRVQSFQCKTMSTNSQAET